MKKYKLKWANGTISGVALTKGQVITAISNWYLKHNGWKYIEVTNMITDDVEVFEECDKLAYGKFDLNV